MKDEWPEGKHSASFTYAINVMMVKDASPTQFASNPRPTPTSETIAPVADQNNRRLRPIL